MSARVRAAALRAVVAGSLALKAALGRHYVIERRVLESVATFVATRPGAAPDLTAATFQAWARTLHHLTPTVRRNRLRIVRSLCLYRRRTEPACFVPDRALFPTPHQPRAPYIFTAREIAKLLGATATLSPTPQCPLRPDVFRVALVLLYTTGLRRGELLRLTLADYARAERVLVIRETKFHKSRVVPLAPATARDHLEQDRRVTASTRNVRLAAIHTFARFLAAQEPTHLAPAQRLLGIPFKRARSRPIAYLEHEEIAAVLDGVDRSTLAGRRDYTLLATMFNTGARGQEILDLRVSDLQLTKPYQVRLVGKGRKVRWCPLWPQTAPLVRAWCAERQLDPRSEAPVFINQRGRPFTRFGVRFILATHFRRTAQHVPGLRAKRLHPHSLRHSTAVHLLKSGVDLATIAHWLGHASVNTTNRYVTVDLDLKRKALARATPLGRARSARAASASATTPPLGDPREHRVGHPVHDALEPGDLPDDAVGNAHDAGGLQPGQASVGPVSGDSLAGYALGLREPVVIEDLGTETRFRGATFLEAHRIVSGATAVIHGPAQPFQSEKGKLVVRARLFFS